MMLPNEPDARVALLQGLLAEHAMIAGDVVEVAIGTWAIHGSIPVDGEVLLAAYDSLADAQRVLHDLPIAADATAPARSSRPKTSADGSPCPSHGTSTASCRSS